MEESQRHTIGLAKKNPWWLSLWAWWAGTSGAYLPLYFVGVLGGRPIFAHIASLIGLFVPIGLFSIVQTSVLEHTGTCPHGCINYLRFLVFPIVLAALFFGEKLAMRNHLLQLSPVLKIVFNLILLFALTFLADHIVFSGQWASMDLLLSGGNISLGK